MSACPVPDSDWLSENWTRLIRDSPSVTVEDCTRFRVWLVNARLMGWGADDIEIRDAWHEVLRRNEKRLEVCDE